MIAGFNTDVDHEGKTFHVQTEERGRSNPVVETLVYCGGEIVTLVSSSYADLAESDRFTADEVLARMEDQHERLIRQILGGSFQESQKPYGHDLITEQSLDEVVRAYLDDSRMLLDHVQQFLDDEESRVEEPGDPSEEAPAGAARAEKLRRILARLEARVESESPVPPTLRDAEAPDVAAPALLLRGRPVHWIWTAAAVAGVLAATAFFVLSQSRPGPAGPISVPAEGAAAASRAPGPGPSAEPPAVAEPSPTEPDPAAGAATVPVDPADAGKAASGARGVASPRRESDSTAREPAAEPAPTVRPREPAAPPVPRSAPALEKKPPVAQRAEPDRPAVAPAETASPPVKSTEALPVPDRVPSPDPSADPGPTPPVVWTGKLVEYDAVDVPPVPLKRELPRYTRRARRQNQRGVVAVEVLVIENGKVAHARLVEEISDSDLNQAALDAALGWEFAPARKDGFAVRVWQPFRIHFGLAPGAKAIVKIEE